MVEHLVYTEGVSGSNPLSPTIFFCLSSCFCWLLVEEMVILKGQALILKCLMKIKFLISFFLYVFCCVAFCASFRTTQNTIDSENQYIAVDFQVPTGEHFTAPVGKGKSIAPSIKWENAETIDIFWPKAEVLKNADGSASDYSGYSKNFTVLYKLKVNDISKPIAYDLFYVSCGDACMPKQQQGTINPNGLLTISEIEKYTTLETSSIWLILLFGFLGGIILNFMPCVFPIVSIKLFSMVKSANENVSNIRKQSIAFALGSIFCFTSTGFLLLLLRNTMPDLGWGFFMQEPKFVVILLIAFLLCGLYFFGLYDFRIPTKRFKLNIKKAYIASFLNGVFGTIVSTSCAGPFVGVAIASAVLCLSFSSAMAVFVLIGVGLAMPFLLISAFPKIIQIFPKPGAWMKTFKEFMGFVMLLSCVWFLWILSSQTEIFNVMLVLASLVVIAFFIKIFGRSNIFNFKTSLSLAGAIFACVLSICAVSTKDLNQLEIDWQEYSKEAFEKARNNGESVFLNFTASWCLNCQFNDRVFKDEEIIKIFKDKNITAMKCDWTNRSQKISNLLKSYGAAAVPFYIYYPKNETQFKQLPTMLSKNKLKSILEEEK